MLDPGGLQFRATLFRLVRSFFHTQGFLEVDTPIRQPVLLPESNITPVPSGSWFLQTSPEQCMKRLLAHGCENIFQICPCFREAERGARHLEEFTMLEWYRKGGDYRDLMEDCCALVRYILQGFKDQPCYRSVIDRSCFGTISVERDWVCLSVEEAFDRWSGPALSWSLGVGGFRVVGHRSALNVPLSTLDSRLHMDVRAAVHDERGSLHEIAERAGQEEDGVGHVLRLEQPVPGHALVDAAGEDLVRPGQPAGGIGFDICEVLVHSGEANSRNIEAFRAEWGVDMSLQARGGVEGIEPQFEKAAREVYLLQRKSSKVGAGLGKTTGWIHRKDLAKKGVQMLSDCEYQKIDDQGLHLLVKGEPQLLEVKNLVICAGQESKRDLSDQVKELPVHLIGGADVAAELDAKRAIEQGTRLAAEI